MPIQMMDYDKRIPAVPADERAIDISKLKSRGVDSLTITPELIAAVKNDMFGFDTPSWLGIPDWLDNPVTRGISDMGEAIAGDVGQLARLAEVYTEPETYATVADPQAWANLPGEVAAVAGQIGHDWFMDPIGYAKRDPLFALADLLGASYLGRTGGLLDRAIAGSRSLGERVSGALGDISPGSVYERLRGRLAQETGSVEWGGMGETLSPEEMAAREAAPAREMLTDADLDILMDTEPITVVVTGSRGWADTEAIINDINRLPPGSTVIHGGARGADSIADAAARARGDLIVKRMPADWATYGRSAGIRRNAEMLDLLPDEVLAYWDRVSPGTRNTIEAARRRGIPVRGVGVPPPPADIPGIPAGPGNLAKRMAGDWTETLSPEEIAAATQAKADLAANPEPRWEAPERRGHYGELLGPDEEELVMGIAGEPTPPMLALRSGEFPSRYLYYENPTSPYQLELMGQRFNDPTLGSGTKEPYSLRELIVRRGEGEIGPRQPPTYTDEQLALIQQAMDERALMNELMRAPDEAPYTANVVDRGFSEDLSLGEGTLGGPVLETEVGMEPPLPQDAYARYGIRPEEGPLWETEIREDIPADLVWDPVQGRWDYGDVTTKTAAPWKPADNWGPSDETVMMNRVLQEPAPPPRPPYREPPVSPPEMTTLERLVQEIGQPLDVPEPFYAGAIDRLIYPRLARDVQAEQFARGGLSAAEEEAAQAAFVQNLRSNMPTVLTAQWITENAPFDALGAIVEAKTGRILPGEDAIVIRVNSDGTYSMLDGAHKLRGAMPQDELPVRWVYEE